MSIRDGVKFEASSGTRPLSEWDQDAVFLDDGKGPQTPGSEGQHNNIMPVNKKFHFDDINRELRLGDETKTNQSCIGVSIDHVLGTLKGEHSYESDPGNDNQQGFLYYVKAMLRRSLLLSLIHI